MTGEASQETGRRGVVRAKTLLWRLLGGAVDLPFNAYDHGPKLKFDDSAAVGIGEFSFDLRGNLRHRRANGLDQAAVEVFVEVKWYRNGAQLVSEFKTSLRRAAVVGCRPDHGDTCFVFFTNVPFGCSHGVALVDGTLLRKCAATWPEPLRWTADKLAKRVYVCIVTDSFERMLREWGLERE